MEEATFISHSWGHRLLSDTLDHFHACCCRLSHKYWDLSVCQHWDDRKEEWGTSLALRVILPGKEPTFKLIASYEVEINISAPVVYMETNPILLREAKTELIGGKQKRNKKCWLFNILSKVELHHWMAQIKAQSWEII